MNTLCLLLPCYNGQVVTDWNPLIHALPCICWGIIGLVAVFFLLKYAIVPLIANWHERMMKEMNYKNEIDWDDRRKAEREAIITKEMKAQIDALKNSIEKENATSELLAKRLEIYEKTMEKLNVEIKPKEKK